MNCQDAKQLLVSYLAREVSDAQHAEVQAHMASCPFCARELHELGFVWRSLRTWEDRSIPTRLEKKILQLSREAVASAQPSFSLVSLLSFLRPATPVAMGLLAALLSALILSSKMNLALVHPLGLTAVGALWTGIYGFIFHILFGIKEAGANSWRDFAQACVVAVGIFLAFTLISPVPSSIQFCRYYSLTQPVIERLSVGGSFFLFGALYALLPMSIAAYFSGGRLRNHHLAKGSLAGVMFVVLLAPSIYLQCAPFAFGVLLVWFGGALLGSVLGGAIGFWVRYRFAGS